MRGIKLRKLPKSAKELLSYEERECLIKFENNRRFALAVKALEKEEKHPIDVVFLDGHKTKTYDALRTVGCDDMVLHSPNVDPRIIIAFKPTAVVSPLITATKYFRESGHTFNAAYLDFMGAVTGNKTKGIYPMAGIDQFLKHTRGDKVILATTIALRTGTSHNDYCDCGDRNHKVSQLELIDEILHCIFSDTGFAIEKQVIGEQIRNMHHVLYILRRTNPDPVSFPGIYLSDGSVKYTGFPSHYVE